MTKKLDLDNYEKIKTSGWRQILVEPVSVLLQKETTDDDEGMYKENRTEMKRKKEKIQIHTVIECVVYH